MIGKVTLLVSIFQVIDPTVDTKTNSLEGGKEDMSRRMQQVNWHVKDQFLYICNIILNMRMVKGALQAVFDFQITA